MGDGQQIVADHIGVTMVTWRQGL